MRPEFSLRLTGPKSWRGAEPCPGTAPPFESAAKPVRWVLPGLVPSFQAFAHWCAGSAQKPGATSAIVRALASPTYTLLA